MLVITRKLGQAICLGDTITVQVIRTGRNRVRLGIVAPEGVQIVRSELQDPQRAATGAAKDSLSPSGAATRRRGAHERRVPSRDAPIQRSTETGRADGLFGGSGQSRRVRLKTECRPRPDSPRPADR
jgi:carbon storage regulator